MRWLSDVLLAAHAERLGRSMVDMIAGSITLRPVPPAFFVFNKGADGGWTPYMLRPDVEEAHTALASYWRNTSTQVNKVLAYHFTDEMGSSSGLGYPYRSPAAFTTPMPGIEAWLKAWLRVRGYAADAASV
jgi:hypothetical protein